MKMQKSVTFVKNINIWKIENIVKLEIFVFIQENMEVLHIAYVIQNIVYLKKFLQFLIMDQTAIIISSQNN